MSVESSKLITYVVPSCSPLVFKPMTPDTIPAVRQILRDVEWRTCDYSVGGIYMWVDYFNYEYCIFDGTLFIRGLDERDRRRPAFAVPVGKMPLPEAVEMLRRYCLAQGCDLLFSAVPEAAVGTLLDCGATSVEPLDCWSDYLYSAAALAGLTGKAFNKKRNHVNRFMADNPGYVFEPLAAKNIPDAIAFFDSLVPGDSPDVAEAEYERQACRRILGNYEAYGFEGALLRDGKGRPVAFTAGEIIGDTLIVHIEKMDHAVAGAGETVNKLFADYICRRYPDVVYINREDDAGDPGLRRAKESYKPIALLTKYNVRF